MLKKLFLTLAVVLTATSAFAVPIVNTWKFDSPGNDVGVVSGPSSCTVGDVCGNSITFTHGALTATATGGWIAFSQKVIQDLNPTNGGLGVKNFNGDEVNTLDWLNVHFNKAVKLNFAAFNNADHGDLFPTGAKFDLWVNDVLYDDITLASLVSINLTGTDFKFGNEFWAWCDDFYLAGLTTSWEDGTPTPQNVPEPASIALVGVGLLGLTMRKRKQA